ncbi:MAG TPA: asparagine synthase-related protein [Vicinamibacterales bacterium]|jgi:asparagine synthetase B (glutamine-hydrolysing)
MPGIVGLITRKPRVVAEVELARMISTLRHESSYTSGTWIDEAAGVYVGWVAHAGSAMERMPIRNERGDVVMVFSGEDYSDAKPDGASYLVRVYESDAAFPTGLNGMFHGIVLDRARGSATLFNDRYGMHRIYYTESPDAFYFAAEAKAILAVRPERCAVDPRGLGEFVACGCVLGNRTLFRDVNLLPGGASWVFRDGALERRASYFSPSQWEAQTPLDPQSHYESLRGVLATRLPKYFNGSQAIGIALTGGLDTRLLMAWRNASRRPLHCYTFGSMLRESQDVRVARRVADVCKQPYQVLTIGRDFLARFQQYAERSVFLTDGNIDLARTPDLYVSEKARTIAPVKIVGTYGSEVFTLAPTFRPTKPLAGLFDPQIVEQARQAVQTYAELRQLHPLTFTAFCQSPWSHHGVLSLEQTQLTVRSPFLDNDFIQAMYQAPHVSEASRDVRRKLIADEDPMLAAIPTDRGVGQAGPFGRASRAYHEFTFKAEYAYDYGMPQRLAQIDHLLAGLRLERLFLGRHKMFHYRIWYRDALAGYVRDTLLAPRALARPYVVRQAVESVVEGHLKGNRNYTTEIHKLMALELAHRQLVDAR